MKKTLSILLFFSLIIACGTKSEKITTEDNIKNNQEIQNLPIEDEWEEVEIDPTLDEDDDKSKDIANTSSITVTKDTIKTISSIRHIKEECDCIHFANNILYGNYQYLDMITTQEQFEEFNDDMNDYFWFMENVEFCINAFNSNGYMAQNPNLDIEIKNHKDDIKNLIAALPNCPGIPIWNQLSEEFDNKFTAVSKKFQ